MMAAKESRLDVARVRDKLIESNRETQLKMLDLLADGKIHRPEELQECLWDQEGDKSNIGFHLTGLRKLLHHDDYWIVFKWISGRGYYQLVQVAKPL